ncbi:dcmp deaminase [Phaffia rhodozyma]|uniref:Deoxycytidylate deaminase n=1 Tax=Phaffia rhodozyma TaxID=264483 RepID=A0A0F7SR58_PHARH|nr:dcmp deaminase [Phaffia rhodozyma]
MVFIALVGLDFSGRDTIATWLQTQKGFQRIAIDQTWRQNAVTTDLTSAVVLQEGWIKRPWFLLVGVKSGTMVRFERASKVAHRSPISLDLPSFITADDLSLYGHPTTSLSSSLATSLTLQPTLQAPVQELFDLSGLTIVNNYTTLEDLWAYLEKIDLEDGERLRPGWDRYFMTLASLASLRSNCMKRRVGCILVRDKRIVSTGYNGTPRGMTNCNQGGCARCNKGEERGGALNMCLCLHAEENALMEAGRERVGSSSILYCNTCPCLNCAIKIVQSGVSEVVYNLAYAMDEVSAKILKEGGVVLRRLG